MAPSKPRRRQPRSAPILCAACKERPCVCLNDWHLLRDATDLIARAAKGEAARAEFEAWTAREQQARREQHEVPALIFRLRETVGRGAGEALRWFTCRSPFYAATGTDKEARDTMWADGTRVRLAHVAIARRTITDYCFRGAVPRTRRREARQ
jgi:hypothetical protein